jgi:hypothetical protein
MQEGEENSGRITTLARNYTTWYEFKKDLEKRSGRMLVNWRWIEVKPKAPLPWNNSHMEAALSVLARLERHKAA